MSSESFVLHKSNVQQHSLYDIVEPVKCLSNHNSLKHDDKLSTFGLTSCFSMLPTLGENWDSTIGENWDSICFFYNNPFWGELGQLSGENWDNQRGELGHHEDLITRNGLIVVFYTLIDGYGYWLHNVKNS